MKDHIVSTAKVIVAINFAAALIGLLIASHSSGWMVAAGIGSTVLIAISNFLTFFLLWCYEKDKTP